MFIIIIYSHGPKLLEKYNFHFPRKRWNTNYIMYLHNLLHGDVDDSEFLSLISFNVPAHCTKNFHIFCLPELANTNNHLNYPIFKMCNSYNNVQTNCDILSVKRFALRNILSELL